MAYLTLYREWRPRSFTEVVGQRHVTQTLTNGLASGRISHAYLLCGPRGTGKTSVARILAKAVNCERGPGPEACQECRSCRAITLGAAMDVFEIDAASNRGIDEIRDLRDKVRFAPAEGRYKVYIIDEVHMLTVEAFNALLKTLEEPPPHVIFILATTEAHRVPQTIASRCQRFDFHRLSAREIAGRLAMAAARGDVNISEEALGYIARRADGSMRDALGLLEQVISFAGNDVEAAHVLEVVGGTRDEVFIGLTSAVGRGDQAAMLEILAEQVSAGADLRQFYREYLGHWRDIMLVRVCRDPGTILDLPSATVEHLRNLATGFTVDRISSVLTHLSGRESDMRWTSQPRLILEVALLELAGSAGPQSAAAPAAAHAPKASAASAAPPAAVPAEKPLPADAPSAAVAGPLVSPAVADEASPTEPQRAPRAATAPTPTGRLLESVNSRWMDILDYVRRKKPGTHAMLREGRPVEARGTQIVIGFRPGYLFHKERCEGVENRSLISTALREFLGRECEPIFEIRDDALPTSGPAARARKPQGQQDAPGATDGAARTPPAGGGGPRGGEAGTDLSAMAELFGGEIVEEGDDDDKEVGRS
jgi:DNA polymerase-3 subunit gamma/tau